MRIEYRVGDISRRGGVLFNLELVSVNQGNESVCRYMYHLNDSRPRQLLNR